jgi:hypothetical protein
VRNIDLDHNGKGFERFRPNWTEEKMTYTFPVATDEKLPRHFLGGGFEDTVLGERGSRVEGGDSRAVCVLM